MSKELVLVDHDDELIVDKDTYNAAIEAAGEAPYLRARMEKLEWLVEVMKIYEEHACLGTLGDAAMMELAMMYDAALAECEEARN